MSERIPTVEGLRLLDVTQLAIIRTDATQLLAETDRWINDAENDPRGADDARIGKLRVRKSAIANGLRNVKNVLREKGVGVPAGGSALPGVQAAVAYVGHVQRLLRAMTELVDTARVYLDDDTDSDDTLDAFTAALIEVETRCAQWLPTHMDAAS